MKYRYFGGLMPSAVEERLVQEMRERFYGRLHPWIYNRTVQDELQWRIQRQTDGFGKEDENLKITIEGTPKEIASLVLELQERRAGISCSTECAECDADAFAEKVIRHLREQPGQASQAISP